MKFIGIRKINILDKLRRIEVKHQKTCNVHRLLTSTRSTIIIKVGEVNECILYSPCLEGETDIHRFLIRKFINRSRL